MHNPLALPEKVIILTRCPVSEQDRALIDNSNIFKVCVNWCDFVGDVRIFHDADQYEYYEENCVEPLITHKWVQDKTQEDKYLFFYGSTPKINTPNKLEFCDRAGTIAKAFDYCVKYGAKKVLIQADNTVHDYCHRHAVNAVLTIMRKYIDFYQFTDGNFRCPVMSIQDFVNL